MIVTYYTAPWCAPCKTMLPKVRKLLDGINSVELHVIDISDPPPSDGRIDIQSIMSVPTLAFPETGETVPAPGIIPRIKKLVAEQEGDT